MSSSSRSTTVDMTHDQPSTSNEEKQQHQNPWADPASFPDGGSKAWLTVAGCSACLFVSFGWVNCIGVFQDYYQQNQLRDYTESDISWIPSLQSAFLHLPLDFCKLTECSILHALLRAVRRQGLR